MATNNKNDALLVSHAIKRLMEVHFDYIRHDRNDFPNGEEQVAEAERSLNESLSGYIDARIVSILAGTDRVSLPSPQSCCQAPDK